MSLVNVRRSIYSAIVILTFVANAFGQLQIKTKPASIVETVTPAIETAVFTPEGDAIGSPTLSNGDPVTSDPKPAVLIQVIPSRPLDEVIIKVRSPEVIARDIGDGWFVVSDPGEHRMMIDVIGQNPLTWDDAAVTVRVETAPDQLPPDDDGVSPPDPAPDAGKPIRMLIIYESETLTTLPASQVAAIRSKAIREQAESAGIEFLALDQDAKFTGPRTPFVDLLEMDRESVPWIVIQGENGIIADEALPESAAELESMIRDLAGVESKTGKRTRMERVRIQIGERQECINGVCRMVPVWGYQWREVSDE